MIVSVGVILAKVDDGVGWKGVGREGGEEEGEGRKRGGLREEKGGEGKRRGWKGRGR